MYLTNEERLSSISHRFGKVDSRYVIYRGNTQSVGSIQYLNVEEYLNALENTWKDDYDRIYQAALQSAQMKKIVEWCNKMVRTTYIRISDEFKDCPNFQVNWPR